jgi:hypothetical protein
MGGGWGFMTPFLTFSSISLRSSLNSAFSVSKSSSNCRSMANSFASWKKQHKVAQKDKHKKNKQLLARSHWPNKLARTSPIPQHRAQTGTTHSIEGGRG